MAHHVIEFDEQCKPCGATGVYVGFAEKDGAAVVCRTCNGSGNHHVKIEYDDFDGKKIRKDIDRVYEANPGIAIGIGGGYKLEDFGGIPYSAWVRGEPFPKGSENRKFTCPSWWYQSVDYKKEPNWNECIHSGSFGNCKYFKQKDECWIRFDKENKKG